MRRVPIVLIIKETKKRKSRGHGFVKYRDAKFKTNRNYLDSDPLYVKNVTEISDAGGGPDFAAERNVFDILLWDVKGLVAAEMKRLIMGAQQEDFELDLKNAGFRRGAWIDDREQAHQREVVDKGNWEQVTTALGLYQQMDTLRFGCPEGLNVDRRLILVRNLDPFFIYALAKTVPSHQIGALRDAIWNHLTFKTLLRVHLPLDVPIFRLDLHISYFTLISHSARQQLPNNPFDSSPKREWIDLAFLNTPSKTPPAQEPHGIYESHISFVICGPTLGRWIGYCFVDVLDLLDEEDLENLVQPDKLGTDCHWDPITNGECDANLPIWDPWEYFLVVFRIRSQEVQEKWKSLVWLIQRRVEEYRATHATILCEDTLNAGQQTEDMKKTFDWTQRITGLLSRLIPVLDETIRTWRRFLAEDSSHKYFSRISVKNGKSQSNVHVSLHAILAAVEEMEGLVQTMQRLDKICRDSATALGLRLQLEASEGVKNNGQLAAFTVSIISPVMVAIAYYSIPLESSPLQLKSQHFPTAIILIMVVVQILFIPIRYGPDKHWWQKKISTWVARFQGEVLNNMHFKKRWKRNGPAVEEIEMQPYPSRV